MLLRPCGDLVASVLLKGMNFCVTPSSIPTTQIVTNTEESIKNLPKEEADTVQAKVSLTLQNAKTPQSNLSYKECKSLKQFQKNENIIILPADKGRATVVLDKTDYYNKCYDHINNGPYCILKKDPTETIKRQVRKKLQLLKEAGYIDEKQYFHLKPSDSPPPRFYGLLKIHKTGTPMRPIVSCTGTPLYNLSKDVATILSSYTKQN